MRPAELPEPDKKAPTPVTAAAALCGDNHQHSSAPALRVTAIAARTAREAAPAVQGQRRGIVRVRAVQDPNAADTLALRRCAGCNARLAGQEHQWGRSGMTSCQSAGLPCARGPLGVCLDAAGTLPDSLQWDSARRTQHETTRDKQVDINET